MDADAAFNQRKGFGGVKMPGMAGVTPGTRHYVLFDPKNIRSRFAKFDPAKKDSRDLLAGIAGAAATPLAAALLMQREERERQY